MQAQELSETERPHGAALNVQQAAAYVGVSVSYLNQLRVAGGGCPYRKIGRRVTYSRDDLDEWLSARRRTSTAAIAA